MQSENPVKMEKTVYQVKKEIYKVINIFFACVLVMLALFTSIVYADEERETIRVGFFAFDGYHTMDENGIKSGYGYEFLRMIARYINVDYEYIGYENSWDDMLDMLEAGEIDLVTSARVTPERAEKFAFTKSIGTSSAMLTVSNENTTIKVGDYSLYDGMRIGMLTENSRNADLEAFAKECGFSYKPVYFEMFTELEEALQSNEIDAILTSSLRKTKNERVLDYFAVEQFYAIVRKDDTELLSKLNYAIDQLNAVEGDWKNALGNEYYFHWEEKELSFTKQEQEMINDYLNGKKELIVSACTDKKPYAYVEDGNVKGIMFDYFAKLADYVGIPYTVVVTENRAEYARWCETEENANVFLDGRFANNQQAEDMKKSITAPYVTMRLAMVTRRDFTGQINTLAVSSSQGLFGIEDGLAPDASRLSVASREEAMKAVLDGKADATFVYLYTAQQYVNQDERGLLTYTMLEEPTYDYHVTFASSVDNTMAGIFTKAIYAMQTGTFENIASEYTSYKAKDVDFITWVRIHPIFTLGVTTITLFMLVLIVIVMERQRAVKKEQERSAQLQELAVMADSSNRAKTMFLNNMSHDIRTPMNAIIGFTSLAESNVDNPQRVKEYLQKISVSSEHLLSLINDVLDMSRIESGRVKIDEQPLYLPGLIQDVRTIVQPTINSKQLTFVIDTVDVRDGNIIADKLRLNQILLNVLSNGVKFNKMGGMLSLKVKQLNNAPAGYASYHFLIKDTGIGMKKEFAKHIFDAFAREETATVSGIPGTGLGMTITKNIVEMMDGEISVDSTEGVGSEFTIKLTFKLSEEAIVYKKQEAKADFTGKQVLLVEDNQLNQEIAVTLLEEMGIIVDVADDGSVAIEKMKKATKGQYDMILMDIQMPFIDGYEATRQIRNIPDQAISQIPIVAMTANAFCSDQEKARECGMNGYITKPVDIKMITAVLSQVLCK